MTAAACVALLGACGRAVEAPGPDAGPFVIVLGTSQDGGLPHAACGCARCAAARRDPSRRRWVASLAIVDPSTGRRFLVDATPDLPEQIALLGSRGAADAASVDRAPVDGVFLTHAHVGHYLGLAQFGFEVLHTRALPVYASPRMTSFLRANAPWSRLVARGEIVPSELAPGATLTLDGGISITPFAVPHRDEDSDTVGFKIRGPRRTIVYVPDTDRWSAWSTPLPEVLEGCDVALLDGTFFAADELPGRDPASIGHPLITATMDLLQAAVRDGRLRVLFTHLNHSNQAVEPGSPPRREIEGRGFGVAEDGQRLPL